jgi:multidrug efflux pump subunit AcrA (membrane-fusion protein)
MQDNKDPASRLTYADVHGVLALLQGWDRGTLSLQYNGLTMYVVMAAPPAPPAIRSPALGIFRPHAKTGMFLTAGEPIANIKALGRTTPVLSPLNGKLLRILVPADAFVEYDQELAVIEPAPARLRERPDAR